MWGRFAGHVVSEWLGDGRSMRLTEPFEYVDPEGARWVAPAGSIVNGASIPRFFWRIVGSPLTGCYRRASVLHDVHCDFRTRSWQHVHRMFYRAMRADGCGWLQASVMYWAVRIFGPKW